MNRKGRGRAVAQPDLKFEKAAVAVTVGMTLSLFGLVVHDHAARTERTAIPVVIQPGPSHVPSREDASPVHDGTVEKASISKPAVVYQVGSTSKLTELFERVGYKLDRVLARGEVPRLFVASLPNDLHSVQRADRRKLVFIKMALPLILYVNERILADRERVKALRDRLNRGEQISALDEAWLSETAERFGLANLDFDALLRRIDIVPPSLALAQSAEESGWGTSRFAREGNALFGQRTWSGETGIVPTRRAPGETFRVRTFGHLIEGVRSYAHNLNSHPAYAEFRKLRAEMRRNGEPITGEKLAGALERYSERGAAYTETIRHIMHANGLLMFDTVRLGSQPELDPAAPDA